MRSALAALLGASAVLVGVAAARRHHVECAPVPEERVSGRPGYADAIAGGWYPPDAVYELHPPGCRVFRDAWTPSGS